MAYRESKGHVTDEVVTPIRLERNISKKAVDAISQQSLTTT